MTATDVELGPAEPPGPQPIGRARTVFEFASAVVVGVVTAYLASTGLWFVALALLAVLPMFVMVHRVPVAAIGVWLVMTPFLTRGVARPAFWAVHRALPVVVLLVLVFTWVVGIRTRRLPRLGWPEAMMAAYLVATMLSIVYMAEEISTSLVNLYDRLFVPMCLYLLVRLLRPGREALRWLVPIGVWTAVTQASIGLVLWVSPDVLPSGWTSRAGERTTGSLASPSVYGVTLLAVGVFAIHTAARARWPRRAGLELLFAFAVVAAVLSFTRAVWLAALLVVVVVGILYPKNLTRVLVPVAPIALVLVMSGAVTNQVSTFEARFNSDDTALSRLPVVKASLRMFNERPITGWGYDNFDRFDREFQDEVSGFFPEKDQASHNVYLTVLAEQGVIGLVLFLGPTIWWLRKSIAGYSALPTKGFMNRKLLILLWSLLGAHVVVNNFANIQLEFGVGQWWLILGLIASMLPEGPMGAPDGGSSMNRLERANR